MSKEEDIERLYEIYGKKYKILDIIREGRRKYVIYECNEHGLQRQRLEYFKKGFGCPKCSFKNRDKSTFKKCKTTEEFIIDATKIHNHEYIYTETEYKDSKTKVCIICPIHGKFSMTPNNHLRGQGCPKCKKEKVAKKCMKPFESFGEEANIKHNFKYEYDESTYKGIAKKVRIICPIHGEFWQTARDHLNGCGCLECNGLARLTTEEFIRRGEIVHNFKYSYVNTIVKNSKSKVKIICPIHGEFEQSPIKHLKGQGCPKCVGRVENVNDIIEKFKKVHNNDYDYSKVELKNVKEKVCIICHKKDKSGEEHGEFWQTIDSHTTGAGCPKCNRSKLESEMAFFLREIGMEFEEQKRLTWLGGLKLDFYLPQYNVAIECQGIQHFEEIEHFDDGNSLEVRIERDERKRKLCEENGLKLLYYSNLGIEYPYEVFEDKDKLLEEIKKYGNS